MDPEDSNIGLEAALTARSSDQSSMGIIHLDSMAGMSGLLGEESLMSPLSPVKQLRQNPPMSEIAESSLLDHSVVSEEMGDCQSPTNGLNNTGYADLPDASVGSSSADSDCGSVSDGSLSDSDGGSSNSAGSGGSGSGTDPDQKAPDSVLDPRYFKEQAVTHSSSSVEERRALAQITNFLNPVNRNLKPSCESISHSVKPISQHDTHYHVSEQENAGPNPPIPSITRQSASPVSVSGLSNQTLAPVTPSRARTLGGSGRTPAVARYLAARDVTACAENGVLSFNASFSPSLNLDEASLNLGGPGPNLGEFPAKTGGATFDAGVPTSKTGGAIMSDVPPELGGGEVQNLQSMQEGERNKPSMQFSFSAQRLSEFGSQISARSTSIGGGSMEARGDNTGHGFGSECFDEMAEIQKQFDDGGFMMGGAQFEDVLRQEEENFDLNGLPRHDFSLSAGAYDPRARYRPPDADESMSMSQYLKLRSGPVGTLGDASVAESVPRFGMSVLEDPTSPQNPETRPGAATHGKSLQTLAEQNSTASTVRRSRETFTMSQSSGYSQIHAGGPLATSSSATAGSTVCASAAESATGTYTVLTAPMSPEMAESSQEAAPAPVGAREEAQSRRSAADSLRRRIVDVLNRTQEAREQLLNSAGAAQKSDGDVKSAAEAAEQPVPRSGSSEVHGAHDVFVAPRPAPARRRSRLKPRAGTVDLWQGTRVAPHSAQELDNGETQHGTYTKADCPLHARDCWNGVNCDCGTRHNEQSTHQDQCRPDHPESSEDHHFRRLAAESDHSCSDQHIPESHQHREVHRADEHPHAGQHQMDHEAVNHYPVQLAGILRQSLHLESTESLDHQTMQTAESRSGVWVHKNEVECIVQGRTDEMKRQQTQKMEQHRELQIQKITEARAEQARLRKQWEAQREALEKADKQRRDELLKEESRRHEEEVEAAKPVPKKKYIAPLPNSKESITKRSKESIGKASVEVVTKSANLPEVYYTSSNASKKSPKRGIPAPMRSPDTHNPIHVEMASIPRPPLGPLDTSQVANEIAEQVLATPPPANIPSVVGTVLQDLSAYRSASTSVKQIVEEVLRQIRGADLANATTDSVADIDIVSVLQEMQEQKQLTREPSPEYEAEAKPDDCDYHTESEAAKPEAVLQQPQPSTRHLFDTNHQAQVTARSTEDVTNEQPLDTDLIPELPPEPTTRQQRQMMHMMDAVSRLHRGEPSRPRGPADRPRPVHDVKKQSAQRSASNPVQRTAPPAARQRTASGRLRTAEAAAASTLRRSDSAQTGKESGSPPRRRPASAGLAVRGRRLVPRLASGARLSDEPPTTTDDSERGGGATPRRPASAGARRPRPPPRAGCRQTDRGAVSVATATSITTTTAGLTNVTGDSGSSDGSARTYSIGSDRRPDSRSAADTDAAQRTATDGADPDCVPAVTERANHNQTGQTALNRAVSVESARSGGELPGASQQRSAVTSSGAAVARVAVGNVFGVGDRAAGVDYESPEFLVTQVARRYPSSTPSSLASELTQARAAISQDVSPIEQATDVTAIGPPPSHCASDEGPVVVPHPVPPRGASSAGSISTDVAQDASCRREVKPAMKDAKCGVAPAAMNPTTLPSNVGQESAVATAGPEGTSIATKEPSKQGVVNNAPVSLVSGNITNSAAMNTTTAASSVAATAGAGAAPERQSRSRVPAAKTTEPGAKKAPARRSRIPTPVRRSESSRSAPSLLAVGAPPVRPAIQAAPLVGYQSTAQSEAAPSRQPAAAEVPPEVHDMGAQTSTLAVTSVDAAAGSDGSSAASGSQLNVVSEVAQTEKPASPPVLTAGGESRLVEIPARVDHDTVLCADIETEVHFTARNLSDQWLHLSPEVVGITVGDVESSSAAEISLRWALLEPRRHTEVMIGVTPRQAGRFSIKLRLRATHMDRSKRGDQLSAVTLNVLAEKPAVELLSQEPGLMEFGTLPEDCRKVVPLTLVNLSRAAAPVLVEIRSEPSGAFHLPEPEPTMSSAARLSPILAQFTLPATDSSREGNICPVTLSVALLTPTIDSDGDCPPLRPIEGTVLVRLEGATANIPPLLVCRLTANVGRVKLRTRCREPIEMRCKLSETTSVSLPMKNTGNIPLTIRLSVAGLKDAVWVRPDTVTVAPRAERSVMLTFQPLDQFSGGDGLLVLTVQPDGLSFEVDIRGVVGERRLVERPARSLDTTAAAAAAAAASPEQMKSARRHRRARRSLSRSPRPPSGPRAARDTGVQTSVVALAAPPQPAPTIPPLVTTVPRARSPVRQPTAAAAASAGGGAQLSSNKHLLLWTGVAVSSAAVQSLTLKNSCDAPLRLKLTIRDGARFSFRHWDGAGGNDTVQELSVAPQGNQSVTVVYRPTVVEVTRATLVIKPYSTTVGERLVKFTIPLVAYSGASEVQLDMSADDGLRMGEVHPGAWVTAALTLANVGDRRTFVDVRAFRDSDCLHPVPASEFSARPARVTLSAGEGRQMALCMRVPAGQPPPACLQILSGDELLRCAFKALSPPVTSRYATLSALSADLEGTFEGEKQTDADEAATFKRVPNMADAFFANIRQTHLPVHMSLRSMESTLFTNLHADDTVASVLNCTSFMAPRESRPVESRPTASAHSAPAAPLAAAERTTGKLLPAGGGVVTEKPPAPVSGHARMARRPAASAASAPPTVPAVPLVAAAPPRRYPSDVSLDQESARSSPVPPLERQAASPPLPVGDGPQEGVHLRLDSEAVVFGPTAVGQRASGGLSFTNTSGVDLRWNLEPLIKPWMKTSAGSETAVGADVFRFHPTQGELKPSQSVQLAARFSPPSGGQYTQTFYLTTFADTGMVGSESAALPSCMLVRVAGQGVPPTVEAPLLMPFPLVVHPDTMHFSPSERVAKLTINNKTRADHEFELSVEGPFAVNHVRMVSRARRYIHLPLTFRPVGPGLFAGRLTLRLLRPTVAPSGLHHRSEFTVTLLGETP